MSRTFSILAAFSMSDMEMLNADFARGKDKQKRKRRNQMIAGGVAAAGLAGLAYANRGRIPSKLLGKKGGALTAYTGDVVKASGGRSAAANIASGNYVGRGIRMTNDVSPYKGMAGQADKVRARVARAGYGAAETAGNTANKVRASVMSNKLAYGAGATTLAGAGGLAYASKSDRKKKRR